MRTENRPSQGGSLNQIHIGVMCTPHSLGIRGERPLADRWPALRKLWKGVKVWV